jgi:hypothetical protein
MDKHGLPIWRSDEVEKVWDCKPPRIKGMLIEDDPIRITVDRQGDIHFRLVADKVTPMNGDHNADERRKIMSKSRALEEREFPTFIATTIKNMKLTTTMMFDEIGSEALERLFTDTTVLIREHTPAKATTVIKSLFDKIDERPWRP